MNSANKAESSAVNIVIHSLKDDPVRQYPMFHQSSNSAASMEGTELNPRGLLGLGINDSDAKHRERFPDIIDADGNATPAPRVSYPYSAEIPEGLTQLQLSRAIHKANAQDRVADIFHRAYRNHKARVIAAAGEDIMSQLMDPDDGLASVEVHHILEYVKDKYAIPNEGDILTMIASTRIWDSSKHTYGNFVTHSIFTHTQLKEKKQELNEYYKIENFTAALDGDGHEEYKRHLDYWKERVVPKLADRTFVAAADYVKQLAPPDAPLDQPRIRFGDSSLHSAARRPKYSWEYGPSPGLNPHAREYHGGAHAAKASHTDPVIDMLLKSQAIMADNIKAMQLAMTASALDSDEDGDRPYCFVHGYDKHDGDNCDYMLARDTKYTEEHLKAKAPCVIGVLQGSSKNK